MLKFAVELTTPDGRIFLLASLGWTSARHTLDPRIRKFATKLDARKAARKAWKAPGDITRTILFERNT